MNGHTMAPTKALTFGAISGAALAVSLAAAGAASAQAADPFAFTAGDLVVSVYGRGASGDTTTYQDNGASPITLQQLQVNSLAGGGFGASTAGQLVLPQSGGAGQNPISGEYGSSSEGILQQSGDGHSLTIAGYDVNAATFNAAPASYKGGTKACIGQGQCSPLAQTPSAAVQRVVALVNADGGVDTSTTLGTSAFNENNPRSVVTANGSSFYVSGQGGSKNMGDATQGVFYVARGSSTPTAIDNAYDTRVVSLYDNTLYVSADSTEGKGVHENISSYGGQPSSAASAAVLSGLQSKFTVTSPSQLNTLDAAVLPGSKIYLSPEQYFFASPNVLYVADSGNPKGDNNSASGGPQGLSDGGLQKWTLSNGKWTLDYTVSAGLGLVPDTTSCGANATDCGSTGLIGLTGKVVDGTVELFATNSTLGDVDPTGLYGVTDQLSAKSEAAGEAFTELYAAGPDQIVRGVAFAPTSAAPEPAAWALLMLGLGGLGVALRRSRERRGPVAWG
jgi:hypothetical protein